MPTYTNPTDSFTATNGADSIVLTEPFNGSSVLTIDAAGGSDSLSVQTADTHAVNFDIGNFNSTDVLDADLRFGNNFYPAYFSTSRMPTFTERLLQTRSGFRCARRQPL